MAKQDKIEPRPAEGTVQGNKIEDCGSLLREGGECVVCEETGVYVM